LAGERGGGGSRHVWGVNGLQRSPRKWAEQQHAARDSDVYTTTVQTAELTAMLHEPLRGPAELADTRQTPALVCRENEHAVG